MKHDDCVLIIEPDFGGHRWRYAEWAAQACTEAGHRCVIVTECGNEDHPLARRIVAANRPDLQIAFVDPPERARGTSLDTISYVRAHRYFRHAFKVVTDVQPVSFVAVPYVDYFLYALPFLGSPFGKTPWIGITMRTTFHQRKAGVKAPSRPLVNTVKTLLFRRAVKSAGMRTLLSIDPTLLEWYSRATPRSGARIEYLADPFPDAQTEDPMLARRRLGLDPDKRYLLVYGAITERKGIFELVETLAARDDAPCLIIAGEQDLQTRAFLDTWSPRLSPTAVIFDSFIPNDIERDLFSACDAVWLGYKGHYGMSGVLVQAYRFGRPVIATTDGLIGWFCRTGELGPLLEDLSPASIACALDDVLKRPMAAAKHQPDGAPREHLLERNTLARFKETLQAAIA